MAAASQKFMEENGMIRAPISSILLAGLGIV
jgi:hypothetical protein